MKNNLLASFLIVSMAMGCVGMAFAQEANSNALTIVIKNHQFDPQQLTVPAGKKIQITVENQDQTPEEFESFDLDREQVVEGNKKITVFLGPLSPGKYNYWADFHKSSTGIIVAQ